MKKLVLSIAALLCGAAGVNAQVTATFKVDMTDFINGGGTINQVVSLAGNFTDRGCAEIPNWTPASGAMTDEGNNVWSRTLTFDGTATDSLNWKYVKGADWGDGDEGASWDDTDPATITCSKPGSNHDRKLLLPSSGNIVVSSLWAKCATITTSISEVLTGLQVSVGPNPTSSTLNIRFGGSANSLIKVLSLDGRIVKTVTTSQAGDFTHAVDVSDVPAGMYYVTVVDGKKGFKTPVVIVK
ncbi:MAG TPA: T9SS type A sorting domain-containing protein [Catalimonadaceae bacterium]|nr:T9SS type A sorting domain-containing protein [Catalimonadaceae bacterium]